jgi:AraC family transcriptional regulator
MQHRIEQLTEKKLIGKKMTMSFASNTTAELWKSFMPRRKEIPHGVGQDLYSIQIYPKHFFEHVDPNASFDKWAAIEVSDLSAVPQDMEAITLPAGSYAVFSYKGPAGSPEPFQYILQTWLPASEYELDTRPHFEFLGEKYKNNDPDSEEEIWIPLRRRNSRDGRD